MRNLFVFLLTIISVEMYSQAEVKRISVKVDYSNTYCGGAKPTKEILDKVNAKHPLSNWVLKLEEEGGTKGIMVKTDKEGNFSKDVKVGTYNVFLTKKINKALKTNVDVNCKKMMAKTYGQLIVAKGHATTYKLTLQFGCSPCAVSKP